MRILHLISQYPTKTGSGIYLTQIYKNFKLRGYEQKVLCAMNSDDMVEVFFDDYEIIKFNGEDLKFPVVGMSDIMPYNSTLFKDLVGESLDEYISVLTRKIKDCILNFKPDIIFTNHLYIMSSIAGNIEKKCKIFGFCHGTDLRQLYKNDIHKDIVLNGITKLDGIFCLSNKQKLEINKVFNYPIEHIDVIGGGYDSDFYYKSKDTTVDKKATVKIIYAGKFSKSKGVIYLLKAFKNLINKYNVKLVLAGGGTGYEYDEIMEFANKMNESVEIQGYLTMKEISDLFRSCHIFAMPSFYEGLSLVTIEAMACGLRVVTNELENLIDFVGDDIISSNAVEVVKMPKLYDTDKICSECEMEHIKNWEVALEKQIINVIKNIELDPIYKKVKKYSWKKIVDNVEKIINNKNTDFDISKWIKDDVIIKIPKKFNDKLRLFEYISNKEFENSIEYSEKEVNIILKKYYEDYALVRRYLVDMKFLKRSKDCKRYWKL